MILCFPCSSISAKRVAEELPAIDGPASVLQSGLQYPGNSVKNPDTYAWFAWAYYLSIKAPGTKYDWSERIAT